MTTKGLIVNKLYAVGLCGRKSVIEVTTICLEKGLDAETTRSLYI